MIISADFSIFFRTIFLGLLIAAFPLAQFFGAPLIGELSDRFGRKKIFIVTIIGGILGYTITGLGIHLKTLSLLAAGRLFTGFFAGNLTLCLASIADISHSQEKRVKNFGWVAAIGGLSFILAIALGGSFSLPEIHLNPGSAFFITAFLSLINLGLMIGMFQESHVVKSAQKITLLKGIQNLSVILQSKEIRIIYLAYFLFMISWVTSMQFLSSYMFEHFLVSFQRIPFLFMGIGLIWALSNLIINPLVSKIFPPQKSFYLFLFGLSLFLFLTLFPLSLSFFLIFFLLAVVCSALCWTNGLATVSINASSSLQGSTLGLNQSVSAIASILGPVIGGIIAGINTSYIFVFTGICSLSAAVFLSRRIFPVPPFK